MLLYLSIEKKESEARSEKVVGIVASFANWTEY